MATTGLFQALMVKNRLRGSDYDRLLDLLNEKTIHLLGIYNRDQAARILCRNVLAQPRLLTFGGADAVVAQRQDDQRSTVCACNHFKRSG